MITGKPWMPYTRDEIEKITNEPGIYEFADGHMETVYIGSSGPEGLRDRLMHYRVDRPDVGIASVVAHFRFEHVANNDAWQMRMIEAYQLAHRGRLPVHNHHVKYENLGDMLHRVTTDKPLGILLDDLRRDIQKGGLEVRDAPGDGFEEMLQVIDPEDPDVGTDQDLSALPGIITVLQENNERVLQMIRPTTLLTMFGQDRLISVARRIEAVAIKSMDEAAA